MGRDAATTREQGRSRYLYWGSAQMLASTTKDLTLTAIFAATIATLFSLGAIAYVTESVFFTDAIISMVAVSAVYYYRDSLLFSWEGALFAAAGWLMNMAGVLGAYEIHWGAIGWDKMLHFVSIFGITLLVHAYLERAERNSLAELALITFFIAQGFGALNELAEFIGSYYFGVGQGLFGMMNGITAQTNAVLDTHWDMVTNTVAIFAGLIYIHIKRRTQIYKRKAHPHAA